MKLADEIREKRKTATPSYEKWLSKHEESLKRLLLDGCKNRFGECEAYISDCLDTVFNPCSRRIFSNELEHLERWLDENGFQKRNGELLNGTPTIVWFVI